MSIEFKPISNSPIMSLFEFSKKHPYLFPFVLPFFPSMVATQNLTNSSIIQISSDWNASHVFPAIMCDENSYLAGWETRFNPVSQVDIAQRRLYMSNMSLSPTLNQVLSEPQEFPYFAKSAVNSTYLKSWRTQSYNNSTGFTIMGQVCNEIDQPISAIFPISTVGIPAIYTQVRLAALQNGNYIAVWHSDHEDGNLHVYGRILDPDGIYVSDILRLSYATGAQSFPDVQSTDEGFVLTFTNDDGIATAPYLSTFDNLGNVTLEDLRLSSIGAFSATSFIPPDMFFTLFEVANLDQDSSNGIVAVRSFKNSTLDPDPLVPYSVYQGWQRGGIPIPLLNGKSAATWITETATNDTLWLGIYNVDTKERLLEYPIAQSGKQELFFQKMTHKEGTNEFGVIWEDPTGICFQMFEYQDETTNLSTTGRMFTNSNLERSSMNFQENSSSISSFLSSMSFQIPGSNVTESSFSSPGSLLAPTSLSPYLTYELLEIGVEYVVESESGTPFGSFQLINTNTSQPTLELSLLNTLEDGEEIDLFLFASETGQYDNLLVTTDDPCVEAQGEWREEENGSQGFYVVLRGNSAECSYLNKAAALCKTAIMSLWT